MRRVVGYAHIATLADIADCMIHKMLIVPKALLVAGAQLGQQARIFATGHLCVISILRDLGVELYTESVGGCGVNDG